MMWETGCVLRIIDTGEDSERFLAKIVARV